MRTSFGLKHNAMFITDHMNDLLLTLSASYAPFAPTRRFGHAARSDLRWCCNISKKISKRQKGHELRGVPDKWYLPAHYPQPCGGRGHPGDLNWCYSDKCHQANCRRMRKVVVKAVKMEQLANDDASAAQKRADTRRRTRSQFNAPAPPEPQPPPISVETWMKPLAALLPLGPVK